MLLEKHLLCKKNGCQVGRWSVDQMFVFEYHPERMSPEYKKWKKDNSVEIEIQTLSGKNSAFFDGLLELSRHGGLCHIVEFRTEAQFRNIMKRHTCKKDRTNRRDKSPVRVTKAPSPVPNLAEVPSPQPTNSIVPISKIQVINLDDMEIHRSNMELVHNERNENSPFFPTVTSRQRIDETNVLVFNLESEKDNSLFQINYETANAIIKFQKEIRDWCMNSTNQSKRKSPFRISTSENCGVDLLLLHNEQTTIASFAKFEAGLLLRHMDEITSFIKNSSNH